MSDIKHIGDLLPGVLTKILGQTSDDLNCEQTNSSFVRELLPTVTESVQEVKTIVPEYLPPTPQLFEAEGYSGQESVKIIEEAEILKGSPPTIPAKDGHLGKKVIKTSKKKENIGKRKLDLAIFPDSADVWRSNQLCEARLEMNNNLMSNKIFCILIAKLDKENFPNVSFETSQLKELFAEEIGGTFYKRLKKSTDFLSKAQITKVFFDKKSGKEKGFSFENIFQILKYEDGIISGRFNDEMGPLLLNLKEHFTVLKLNVLLSFESFYSQRLYEILETSRYKGEIEYDLLIIQDMVAFPEKLRNNFKNFRIKVLDKGKREIEKLTDLKFEYFPIKSTGRAGKVVAVKIVFGNEKTYKSYNKHDYNYLFNEKSPGYELWKINKYNVIPYFKNILLQYTSSKRLLDKISLSAAEIGFDLNKFILHCVETYNSSPRTNKSNIKAYIISSIQYKLGFKTPPEFKR
jgi:hypothetical protein